MTVDEAYRAGQERMKERAKVPETLADFAAMPVAQCPCCIETHKKTMAYAQLLYLEAIGALTVESLD